MREEALARGAGGRCSVCLRQKVQVREKGGPWGGVPGGANPCVCVCVCVTQTMEHLWCRRAW